MSEQKKEEQKVEFGTKSLSERLFYNLLKLHRKLDVVFWMFPNGQEIAFYKTQVSLDSTQVEFKGKLYHIDQSAIQNRLGKPTINIQANNSIGALRFIKPAKNRDAMNTKDLFNRGVLTALWHSWKLPFVLLIVMGIANVVLGMAIAYFAGSFFKLEAENEVLKAQIEQLKAPIDNTNRGGNVTPIPQR